MQMDEVLASTAEQMKNFAITYLVDISQVPVSSGEGVCRQAQPLSTHPQGTAWDVGIPGLWVE